MQKNAELVDEVEIARKGLLFNFCHAMEKNEICYVILSGYQNYPEDIDSDIDFMVSEVDFFRLKKIFLSENKNEEVDLIQVLNHEISASYYILAKKVRHRIAYIHPDASANYRRKGRLWLRSEIVLKNRRRTNSGFWVPSVPNEFEYYFIKRIDKKSVEQKHLDRFSLLIKEDENSCNSVLNSLVGPKMAVSIIEAINKNNLKWFLSNRDSLQAALLSKEKLESISSQIISKIKNLTRLAKRIIHPTGFVIAVLGPDGSGKTTVIDHIETEFSPAFRGVRRFHLRPRFGKIISGVSVDNPHGETPRGYLMSVAKIYLFLIDYYFGWMRIVVPEKIRSTLIIFDRYYHDMMIDSVRYRLPKKFYLTKWLSIFVPKPDLWIVLTAKPELLVARKGEISLSSAQDLCAQYENFALNLKDTTLIDTSTSLNETLESVSMAILEKLKSRFI